MAEAFKDADVVYPKKLGTFLRQWKKRTELYGNGDQAGIDQLEQELLFSKIKKAQRLGMYRRIDEKQRKTAKALYMHCLPADITGVSCEEGEVEASVFDRYRVELYKEASYKPYVIAAMIFLSKVKKSAKKP